MTPEQHEAEAKHKYSRIVDDLRRRAPISEGMGLPETADALECAANCIDIFADELAAVKRERDALLEDMHNIAQHAGLAVHYADCSIVADYAGRAKEIAWEWVQHVRATNALADEPREGGE
jgi:hypothetical protein